MINILLTKKSKGRKKNMGKPPEVQFEREHKTEARNFGKKKTIQIYSSL